MGRKTKVGILLRIVTNEKVIKTYTNVGRQRYVGPLPSINYLYHCFLTKHENKLKKNKTETKWGGGLK